MKKTRIKTPSNSVLGTKYVPISDKITPRLLSDIKPSPENDKLYRPNDPHDPDFQAFLESIRLAGCVREALFVTIDGFIVSGHRRYAAAKIVGLKTVPCRTVQIYHDDPRFLPLLRECNRQRAKSIDEVLREEILSANPDDSYTSLVQYRRQAAQVKVEAGVIEGVKHRAVITEAKRLFLDAIQLVLKRLRDFWPLSDRLIHYQLLNGPPLIHAGKPTSIYRNDQRSYKALTELLTRARIAGTIPFTAIHDPTRPITTWDAFRSPGPFIRRELDGFLKAFWRDLQAPQPCHVEILGEKNTIASIKRPVAADYTIPFTLGRGYSSLPPRHDMAQRFRRTGKDRLILLVLADLDPEGDDIAHSFARSMRDDFGIKSVEFIKVALTVAQVAELGLPPGPTAKADSSRRKKFVQAHGEYVYELEAVAPERLQRILRETIESVIDMRLFRQEQAREKKDSAYLAGVRNTIQDLLAHVKIEE
jgi:hypothetical protein